MWTGVGWALAGCLVGSGPIEYTTLDVFFHETPLLDLRFTCTFSLI